MDKPLITATIWQNAKNVRAITYGAIVSAMFALPARGQERLPPPDSGAEKLPMPTLLAREAQSAHDIVEAIECADWNRVRSSYKDESAWQYIRNNEKLAWRLVTTAYQHIESGLGSMQDALEGANCLARLGECKANANTAKRLLEGMCNLTGPLDAMQFSDCIRRIAIATNAPRTVFLAMVTERHHNVLIASLLYECAGDSIEAMNLLERELFAEYPQTVVQDAAKRLASLGPEGKQSLLRVMFFAPNSDCSAHAFEVLREERAFTKTCIEQLKSHTVLHPRTASGQQAMHLLVMHIGSDPTVYDFCAEEEDPVHQQIFLKALEDAKEPKRIEAVLGFLQKGMPQSQKEAALFLSRISDSVPREGIDRILDVLLPYTLRHAEGKDAPTHLSHTHEVTEPYGTKEDVEHLSARYSCVRAAWCLVRNCPLDAPERERVTEALRLRVGDGQEDWKIRCIAAEGLAKVAKPTPQVLAALASNLEEFSTEDVHERLKTLALLDYPVFLDLLKATKGALAQYYGVMIVSSMKGRAGLEALRGKPEYSHLHERIEQQLSYHR